MGATLADGGMNPITEEAGRGCFGVPLRAGGDDHSGTV